MQPRRRNAIPAIVVLHNVNVRIILGATVLIETTRRLELLVLSLFILGDTDSLFQLQLVLACAYVPWVVVGPFGGIIADRFNRQRVLVMVESLNLLTSIGILLLIVSDQLQPWHVYIAVLMQGSVWCVEQPSRRTAIFDIVGQGRVVNAISLEMIVNTAGRMMGPILGGVLLTLAGFTGAFAFAMVLHLLALVLLTQVAIPHNQTNANVESVFTSLVEGVRHLVHNPMLLGVLYISFVVNALMGPVLQFIPAIGRDELGVGAALVGLLAAAEGFGTLMSAGVMASITNIRYHGRVYVVGSLIGMLMALVFAWSQWYVLSFIVLTAGGIGLGGFGTMQNAITMLAAPREMRGRMVGLRSIFIGVGHIAGALEIGAVAAALGTRWAISGNLLVALMLFLPALVLTPLLKQQFNQPQASESPAERRDEAALGS